MGQWREGRVGFDVEEVYKMTRATERWNGSFSVMEDVNGR